MIDRERKVMQEIEGELRKAFEAAFKEACKKITDGAKGTDSPVPQFTVNEMIEAVMPALKRGNWPCSDAAKFQEWLDNEVAEEMRQRIAAQSKKAN